MPTPPPLFFSLFFLYSVADTNIGSIWSLSCSPRGGRPAGCGRASAGGRTRRHEHISPLVLPRPTAKEPQSRGLPHDTRRHDRAAPNTRLIQSGPTRRPRCFGGPRRRGGGSIHEICYSWMAVIHMHSHCRPPCTSARGHSEGTSRTEFLAHDLCEEERFCKEAPTATARGP